MCGISENLTGPVTHLVIKRTLTSQRHHPCPTAVTTNPLTCRCFHDCMMKRADVIIMPIGGWSFSEVFMSNLYLSIHSTSLPVTAEESPHGFKLSKYPDINCVTWPSPCLRPTKMAIKIIM